jgi:hypothetical protein
MVMNRLGKINQEGCFYGAAQGEAGRAKPGKVGLRSGEGQIRTSGNFLLDFPSQRFIKEKIHNLNFESSEKISRRVSMKE